MIFYRILVGSLALLVAMFSPDVLFSQDDEEQVAIRAAEEIQVTATRVPEAVEPEPAMITIVGGNQLRQTGAADLGAALALVAGVAIAPGGDGGPASSVPEFWGLREFDAFLLVVDNVPWGGAFNPALSTLDLNDIDRIEILRGAAPVMYGATSFVGVIHVIHRSPAEGGNSARLSVGNFSSGGGALRFALPSGEEWKQSLSAGYDAQGYRDDRTAYDRAHVLYRLLKQTNKDTFHLDADVTVLKQDPASPHPRSGPVLSPEIPLDANHNPSDARQDENRFHFVGGYDRHLAGGDLSSLVSITRAERDNIKGFLTDVTNSVVSNAVGFRQDVEETDLYMDTHFAKQTDESLRYIVGIDYLFGKGDARSDIFDYFVALNGDASPRSSTQSIEERTILEDERNFLGLYGQVEWKPAARWLLQSGLRFNNTREKREGQALEAFDAADEEENGKDELTTNRLSGTIGVSYLAWSKKNESLWIFADYRNSFKPAAVDFGPEAEGEILKPETANSYEAGMKGKFFNRKFDWQASVFLMDFENLVTATVANGLPALMNAGEERFKGFEIETGGEIFQDTLWRFGYSFHSARFQDFVQSFDGVPTQLAGNRLEMSPEHLLNAGFIYDPAKGGLHGSFLIHYCGERFLNKRNTVLADGYSLLNFGVGYHFHRYDVRFDINNITDERPPVAESELGDAQYYRQPARTFRATWQANF